MPVQFYSLRILIIEDNPVDFFLLNELLGISRVSVRELRPASSIREAAEILEANTFDLILLDLFLPDCRGLETFVEINRLAHATPIIVMSGLTDAKIALDTVRLGAQDYLVKGEFDEKSLEKSIYYSVERKNSLAILQQSEEKYKYLFDNNPVPMWAYDKETLAFLMVNDSAIKHYGYTREEFLSMTIKDIRPAEGTMLLTNPAYPLNSGTINTGIWQHLRKNGSIIYAEIVLHPIQLMGRNADLVLANDVTERIKTQRNMHFQANILQNITDVVIVTDLNGQVQYWNQRATALYGYAAEKMMGKPWFGTQWYTDANFELETLKQHLQQQREYLAESRVKTKRGKYIWTETKVSFVYDAEDQATGLLVISKDITTRKKIAERLMIRQSALEAVGMGITISDPNRPDNPLIYANPKFLELSGYSEEELLGRNCRFLQGEKTDPERIEAIRTAIEKRQHFSGEILNYRKNGEPFWNLIVIGPIFDDQGQLINFVGFQQDITEKKRAEDELIYRNREMNTFIYRASHDLRSPIASLIGLAQIAKLDFTDQKVLNYFDMMYQSSVRLDDILRNLLNLTAIRQGEPQYEELFLGDLVDQVVTNLSNAPHFKDTVVNQHFDKQTRLKTDPTILYSIVQNLLENSAKYRKSNLPHNEVTVSYARRGNHGQLKISDNGIGISSDNIDKVFDMFYRGTDVSKGSGLGLYIVKTFVEKLNGKVDITSELNVGTTVTIHFTG